MRHKVNVGSTLSAGRFPQTVIRWPSILGAIVGLSIVGLLAVCSYIAPVITVIGLSVVGLGVPLFLLVFFRPEFGLLGIIVLASSFVPLNVVDLRLPIGGGLDLRDIVFLMTLATLILHLFINMEIVIPWWQFSAPFIAFLGFGLFSLFYSAFYKNTEINWAFRDFRSLIFYCSFFITSWSIISLHQLKIVILGLFVIADLTTGVVIIQQFLGTNQFLLSAMLNTDWHVMQQSASSSGFGLVRIMPPGHLLMYFMAVLSFGLILFSPRNRWIYTFLVFQLIYINFGLVLTYTRAQWMASAIAMALITLAFFSSHKTRIAKTITISMAVLSVLIAGSVYFFNTVQINWKAQPVVDELTSRALSIFSVKDTLETSSLEWRLFENGKAFDAIRKNPWFGVGLGNRYRELTLLRGEALGKMLGRMDTDRLFRYTRHIHNSYLSITVKMGAFAFLCFLWMYSAFLRDGLLFFNKSTNTQVKGIIISMLAGFAGLLLWAFFHPHFMEVESTTIIGLIPGLVFVSYEAGRRNE